MAAKRRKEKTQPCKRCRGTGTEPAEQHCGYKARDCYPGQWCGCVCAVCEGHSFHNEITP
jgi:hypothetical protein